MNRSFHLEQVGKEEDLYATNGEATSGFGLFRLTNERYPDLKCPDGLADAHGRDILRFLSVSDIYLYRNPYDKNDAQFGASVLASMEWEFVTVFLR